MTIVTVSNFGLEKFVASGQDMMVYLNKLKNRKLYIFRDFEWKNVRTYNAAIV